ncbi:MAG: marine proteobacterial sortase target protein [Vicinamibacteria bacterium]|nr:marine proteobacterial sortase target protein [Vicinamibacteria bacterium]
MTYGRRHYLTQQVLVRLAYAGPSSSEAREFLKASARFVLAITLIFFGLAALANGAELAQEPAGASPNAATAGEFLYRPGAEAAFEVAPTVETRVRFDVTGVIARATVVQRFRNPLDQWIEGVYVFPLPESSAVDHMRMRAGERVIEGEIREKEKARQEFQKAAAEGKRASLVEQQRPNLFTSRVANLGPLEELEVEIEYQQTLELEEGRVGLRFPLTMTPRYMPGIETSLALLTKGRPAIDQDPEIEFKGDDETGAGDEVEHCQDDAGDALLQPLFLPPTVKRNPVSIELNLNAGFEVASLASETHPLAVQSLSGRSFHARLRDELAPTDRDFEVSWKPAPGVQPQSSITTEKGPDGTYALVTLFPPTGSAARTVRIPREVTFVIDTSGSMEGVSMKQAKRALELAIQRLDAEDWFNVIQFNSVTSTLFDAPVPATPENRMRAMRYAASLSAQGGTEMLPALLAALAPSAGAREEGDVLRQVLFLTDGAVGNEEQLFSAIKAKLGRARLFTVGIGSAPNSHFMTKAAEFGRGTFTFISDVNAVEKQMSELYAKVESPVLSDIQVSFDGVEATGAEVWPDRVPDLYLGEPVVVGARFEKIPAAIRVTGRRDGEPFETVVPFGQAEGGRGINVLWARRKIQSLLDGLHEGDDPEAVRAQVVSLGLTHHLVTAHTSLVAVDVTPVRPGNESAEPVMVPVNLPNGATFGSLPQSATPAAWFMVQGLVALVVAAGVLVVVRR